MAENGNLGGRRPRQGGQSPSRQGGQLQSRQERRRQERRRGRDELTRRPAAGRRWWIVGGIVAALVILAGGGYYFAFAQNQNSPPQAGGPVDNIQCGAMEGQVEHIHSHVALFWNGKPVTIPAYIGIPFNQNIAGNYCYYWLHTHATTNVVHIEAPANGTYTLGQFVDIWHYTALWDSQSAIAQAPNINASFADALRAARPSDVHVYVGNKLVNTPYRDVTLADHKNITVELGTPLKPPVATFDWQHWKGL